MLETSIGDMPQIDFGLCLKKKLTCDGFNLRIGLFCLWCFSPVTTTCEGILCTKKTTLQLATAGKTEGELRCKLQGSTGRCVTCGCVCWRMVRYGFARLCLVVYGYVWLCMVVYGSVWLCVSIDVLVVIIVAVDVMMVVVLVVVAVAFYFVFVCCGSFHGRFDPPTLTFMWLWSSSWLLCLKCCRFRHCRGQHFFELVWRFFSFTGVIPLF